MAQRVAHLGPATYDVNSQSIAVQSISDAILKKTMKGGFGSNQPRRSKDDHRSLSADVLPGPGHYEIRTDIKTTKEGYQLFTTWLSCTVVSNLYRPQTRHLEHPALLQCRIE